jgi:SAM-dependent methyltransferase
VQPDDSWGDEVAERYDTPGVGMFAPDVVGPAVERLAQLAGTGRALELAIGTGRVAVPLSERGVSVVGIDSSAPMVERLHRKVDAATIPTVCGDMATTRVDGEFSLVFLVFNGISNLLTQREQEACFRNAARHLAPGGRFVIELWVPDPPADRQATVFHSEPGYIGVDVYDVPNHHVVSHHFRFGEDSHARVFRSAHRYVSPAELDAMAQTAGFALESRHASWSLQEFTSESPSHISVYQLLDRR